MSLFDLFITPLYLSLILLFLFLLRPYATNVLTKPFFLNGFYVRVIGALSLGLIYQFYYGGGDTLNYYSNSKHLYQAFYEEPTTALKILFAEAGDYTVDGGKYTYPMWFFRRDAASFFVVKTIAVLGITCFNSYTIIAIYFALFSFSGAWAFYKTIARIYPYLYKELAWGTLFVPSIFFWGSGIMKDTLTYGAIGWITWAFYNVFFLRRKLVSSVIIFLIMSYLTLHVKDYIIICFIPSLAIWYYMAQLEKIQNKQIKYIVAPVTIVIGLASAVYLSTSLATVSDKYNLDSVVETAKTTAGWLQYVSIKQDGSIYTLSEPFDGSIRSMIVLAPQAFAVTYFRPFLWEVRNPVMLLSAIESLIITFLFVRMLFKKPKLDAFCIAAMAFSTIFGIAIGISTSNFGSLVRYKIPSLIFFVSALIIMQKKQKPN